ncbi:hypothetical protein V2J09_020210 [Rumex salicifolius]
MDARFPGLSLGGSCSSHPFQELGGLLRRGDVADNRVDTTLRLDSIAPHFPISKGTKRKWSLTDGNTGQHAKRLLGLGLHHHSSSSSESKCSSATGCTAMSSAKETEEESSMYLDLDFSLHLGSEKSPSPKKPAGPLMRFDLELSLSTVPSESDITSVHQDSPVTQNGVEAPPGTGGLQLHDESSSFWEIGTLLPPFHAPEIKEPDFFFSPIPRRVNPISNVSDLSASIITAPKSSVTCTSGIIESELQPQRASSSKTCKFTGCSKGARGASGLCIAHGGGRRCQKLGCHKGAEGRTAFCKAHGGGRRCQSLGCTKSAEGRTEFCIAHGGGRRCSQDGCTKAARGKSGLCIRHGGGKRCQMENCTRSAEGLSGLCISHGGGRRCQYPECTKGAQGSTMFCKAHGGGKRCTIEGCTKGAEGSTAFCKGHGGGKRCSFPDCPKSVHGGTSFCVAHGGGKRCAVPDCTKSARGRTDFCVRHGGGRRCQFEGCDKSAQGSTDFCKAHGGGKRCSWGQPGYGNPADGPCGSFARGKTGLCAMHGALVQDKRVHGGITLGPLVHTPASTETVDMNVDYSVFGCSDANSAGQSSFQTNHDHFASASKGSSSKAPEGRVHGGSLLAMLAAGTKHGSS